MPLEIERIHTSEIDQDWWAFSTLILMHQCVFPKLLQQGYKYKIEILDNVDANIANARIEGNIPLLIQTFKEKIGDVCTFRRTKNDYDNWLAKHMNND